MIYDTLESQAKCGRWKMKNSKDTSNVQTEKLGKALSYLKEDLAFVIKFHTFL